MAKVNEKLVAKARVRFLIEEEGIVSSEANLGDRINWVDGMVYLSDVHIWLAGPGVKHPIPYRSITSVDGLLQKGHFFLAVRYKKHNIPKNTYIHAPRSTLQSLKHRILVLSGKKAAVTQEVSELEKQLAVLLYHGVTDTESLQFFLKTTKEKMATTFEALQNRGFVDGLGSLTTEGIKFARKVKETEGGAPV